MSGNDVHESYAVLCNPYFGLDDRDHLSLQFKVEYADGGATSYGVRDMEHVRTMLVDAGVSEVSQLHGKPLKTWRDGPGLSSLLQGVEIATNLIPSRNRHGGAA